MQGRILNLPACTADMESTSGQCYAVTMALFGVNPYGEQISGMLFYKFNNDKNNPTACTHVDPSFGINDMNDANSTTKILLVDRGTCSFVQKVRMGQVPTCNETKKIHMSIFSSLFVDL